ncbi:pyruvate dehydrogenase (acetyl-transferring) E1 component subunit alpha [Pilimelia columellifera]|uniref:Pyruvate dehydrogenase (Acetyl-transferring) E1 component subunit alpha n=1 Tax=Pilimelia columellifera subsp. columellifera TaxID=706583 RepID=A0ABP6A8M1_9ACTN
MAKGDAARPRRASSRAGRGTTLAEPELVQLLTPEGERIEKSTGANGVEYSVDFSDEEYRGLYRDLVIVRKLDTEANALCRQGELSIWASLAGQEAAQVGAGRAMRPQDMAFPTYREHGVLYCRGIDPIMPLSLFRGVDQGGWDPNKYKFNMYTIVIGAQSLHGTGYAMGINFDGRTGSDDGEAVMAFMGDGATSQGDVHESMVYAGVFNAPIVFFVQNNQFAISEPTERQTRVPLYKRSSGYGFPGVRVDGNDVLASYAVAKQALDHARNGNGPSLVEAFTYRMGPHTTTDDPTRYRESAELEEWKAKDPILRMRAFLEKQKVGDKAFFASVDAEAHTVAMDLRDRTLAMPNPQPVSMFDNVYPNGSPLVDAQREEFSRYHASFEGSAH